MVELDAKDRGKPLVNTEVPAGVPCASLHGQTRMTTICGAPAVKMSASGGFTVQTMADKTLEFYQRVLAG